MNWEYNDDKTQIILDKVPRSKKKVTGTRLAAVLGLNDWNTPFQAWCEITKLAQPPFEGNKYTEAGKAIEPKLIQLVRDCYYDLEPENVKDPKEYFGNIWEEVSKKYDFFGDKKILGGMWDAVHIDENDSIDLIIECKTSSRPQDWMNGVPKYYALQGLLYAYLTGATKILFPVAFLKEEDYAHPENYICDDTNSKIFEMSIYDTVNGKTIQEHISDLEEWYNTYINGAISPKFDEDKDKDYLDIIRKASPINDNSLDDLIKNYDYITSKIDEITTNTQLDELIKQGKILKESITSKMKENMADKDDSISHNGYVLQKSQRIIVDNDKLKADGIFDNYIKVSYSYTLKKEK